MYNEIKIGTQIWMTDNLDVSTFCNGDPILHVQDTAEWKKTGEENRPAGCYYNNDPENGKKYGKLYNGYAATDPRGLAPEGWHVPSKTEFETLLANWSQTGTARYDALISDGSAGFDALLGGYRYSNGSFSDYSDYAYFWSTTPYSSYYAWFLCLGSYSRNAYLYSNFYQYGFTFRCIKN